MFYSKISKILMTSGVREPHPMILKVFGDARTLGQMAGLQAAATIKRAITQHGSARILAATGASQSNYNRTTKHCLDGTTVCETAEEKRISAELRERKFAIRRGGRTECFSPLGLLAW